MLGSSFFVQNSGTADQPAGLSVGDGGLTIINNGSEPAAVTIYGMQKKSDGTVNSGEAFFSQVEFGGSGGFNNGSTVNGCGVGSGCAVTPPPVDPPPPVKPPPPPNATPGVESILGPIGLMNSPGSIASQEPGQSPGQGESEDDSEDNEEEDGEGDGGVDASVGLINTGPVSLDITIDDPVTSGSDGPSGQ
jgi:hypothetical protein